MAAGAVDQSGWRLSDATRGDAGHRRWGLDRRHRFGVGDEGGSRYRRLWRLEGRPGPADARGRQGGGPRRVRVNAIAPGGVETPIWRDVPFFQDIVREKGEAAAFDAMAAMATPLGRYAKADEIAAQIAFLLGDDSATITGALLASDGGYTL